MFTRCQITVQRISHKGNHGTEQEKRLAKNIVSSVARSLQDMSLNFRKTQSDYLRSKLFCLLIGTQKNTMIQILMT